MLEGIQVNMPYRLLRENYMALVLEQRMNLEIGFDCCALDSFGYDDFRKTAEILLDRGIIVTFHAPFFDLRPGSLDRKVRDVTVERLGQVFELVPLFAPRSVVCHPAFDRRYYAAQEEAWLDNSIATFAPFVARAGDLGTTIMLENVYDDRPDELNLLLEGLGFPRRGTAQGNAAGPVGICFDTGHWNAFSATPLEAWMDMLGPAIGEVHLHDNDGSADQHLPPGEGTFPFHDLLRMLALGGHRPILTIEPHSLEDFRKSLENLAAMGLLRS